jgi:glycosyltransferase involved in cell wall biosynthesis
VSVVVPVRDRRRSIERAVRSALCQSPPVREVIVIDDGSTDGTWESLGRLCAGDARVIRLRNLGRRGAQGARNTGILAARGEWVAFLDSDDFWLADSVKRRFEAARGSNAQVVHSNYLVTRAGRPPVRSEVPALRGDVLMDVLRAPGPVFPSLLVTRQALVSIGMLDDDIVAFQEWDTAIRLARCFEFAFCEEPTFVYDCSSHDAISADLRRGAAGYAQVATKHHEEILAMLGREALARHWVVVVGQFSTACDVRGVAWSLARLSGSCARGPWLAKGVLSVVWPWLDRARTGIRSAS